MHDLDDKLVDSLLAISGARSIRAIEPIQSLWSGYGRLLRVHLSDGKLPSVIVKLVTPPQTAQHPRGWASGRSDTRKRRSYAVEAQFYQQYATQLPVDCRVAKPLHIAGGHADSWCLVLEDLAVQYPAVNDDITVRSAKPYLAWLAALHAHGLGKPTTGLWTTGCYWHLATRPDELEAMPDGRIKRAAHWLDERLSTSRFQTLVHGDAKIANFCASEEAVAAVDFQYVGGGPGVRDLTYFLGSAFNESELEQFADELVDTYFAELRQRVSPHVDADALEADWRELIPVAWTDFTRFLMGWAPEHAKLNRYTARMAERALEGVD